MDRTTVRRIPEKQVRDRSVLDSILDAGRVAHVAVLEPAGANGMTRQPYVVPVGYARDGDTVLFHGSTASRLFRALADGAPTCLTVTLLDGLVAARSLFESSMHYRSAMVLGTAVTLAGEDRLPALMRLSEHLMPGRSVDARHPSRKEIAATLVLALPLTEWSVKVSDGPPNDLPEDVDRPVWAGVLPLREVAGTPLDAPDLRSPHPVPAYVERWTLR